MGNKLFGTDGVRGVANVYPMTADFAYKLAAAAGRLICVGRRRVAIGKDTRISGDMLEAAMAAGFMSQGVDVVLLGVLPTPAVTTVTPSLDVDMSVMITASHNPYHDNGIKLINANGDKFSDDVTSTLEAAVTSAEVVYDKEKIGRLLHNDTAAEKYVDIALKAGGSATALKGLKVVLDCANGCFSKIMPEVFQKLGAEVIVTANMPDGRNINRDCGSQHPQAMMDMVRSCGAMLGIAVDGDGDRIIVCDENGVKVNSEQVIAFLAQYMKQSGQLNGRAVVSTVLSNTGLDKFVKSLGVEYYSTAVGERYVIEKMREVNGAVGGEESGHVVIADFSRTGDALMVAIVLAKGVLASGKKMSEIFPVFELEPFVFVNPRFDSQDKIRLIMNDEGVRAFVEQAKKDIEGRGRVVVRASGTEPLIRIWVGGEDEALVRAVSSRLVEKIESFK